VTSIWRNLLGYKDSEEFRARRAIVHENKNEAQKSISTARTLRKASDEALKVSRCAIRMFESTHEKKDHE
jgi:hypothetical protein